MFQTLFRLTCLVLLAGLALVGCTPQDAASPSATTLDSPMNETERSPGPGVASGEEAAADLPQAGDVPFPGAMVLAQGLQLKYDDPDPRFFVITDQDTWADFWQTYAPEGRKGSPAVDFDRSFVLVGIQGAKSTGGYNIAFDDLKQSGDEVRVVTDLREPGPGESVEMAFTQPYVIVQVESASLAGRRPRTVVFETDAGHELERVIQAIDRDRDVAPVGEVPTDLPEPASIPFPGAIVLAQGLQLKYDDPDPRFFVITDQDAWADFWQTYAPEGRKASPAVDFGTSFVLVGIQGAKGTGGYNIAFNDLEQSGDEVHVVTDLREPGSGESVEMAFTQPYIIVQVESARLTARGPLTFVFETDAGQELGRVTRTISD